MGISYTSLPMRHSSSISAFSIFIYIAHYSTTIYSLNFSFKSFNLTGLAR